MVSLKESNVVDASRYADLIAKARIEDEASEWPASCSSYVAAAKVADTNPRRAYALNNAAISSRRAGEIDEALRFLIQASDALRDEDDVPTKAEMELAIGNTLVDAQRLSDAIPHLEAAIDMFRRLSRNEESLHAEIGLGRAFAIQGRDAEAEQLFLRVLSEGHSDELLSQGLNNLAIIRRRQGRHHEAEELFRRDADLCESGADSHGRAVALTNLARVKGDLGKTAEALTLLEQASALFRNARAAVDAERVEKDLTILRSQLNS